MRKRDSGTPNRDLRDYCGESCRVTDILLHLDTKNYFGGLDETCIRNKRMADGSTNVL